MTRYFLSRVQVEGFRGINNENDPLDVKLNPNAVNSVFAANGLGKSSLFEALSYAITGSVPKLEHIPAAESPREYYCNRFHSKQAARVILTILPDDGGKEIVIEVQRAFDGRRKVSSPTGQSDPEGLLRALDQETILLDNYTFGTFLDDSPLERGRSFSSLLGLSQLSQVRQALEMVAETRAYQADFDVRVLENAIITVRDQLTTSMRSLRQDYLKLVGQQLPEPLDPKKTSISVSQALAGVPLLKDAFSTADLHEVDFEKVSVLIKDAERGEDQERLRKVLQEITTLEALASTANEAAEQTTLDEACTRKEMAFRETRGGSFKDLYEAVKKVLDEGNWPDPTLCPACESRPKVPPAEFIEKQLQQYERVAEAQKHLIATWTKSNWPVRLRKLEAEPMLKALGYAESYPPVKDLIEKGKETLENLRATYASLARLEAARITEIERLKAEKKSIGDSLPPSLVALTEQVEHAKRIREQLTNYEISTAALAKALGMLKRRNDWKMFIDNARKTFEDAEAAMSKNLTNAMDSQYKAMYAKIAGGTHIVPSLRQQPGSVELHIKLDQFFGLKNTAAIPLLPESYKNALAISIFLSAALQRKTSARFIVLDDVTSSFDAGHQFEVMEVLRTQVGRPVNPDGLQVIVFSHDGLLEKYFDRLGNTKDWHHQHMQGLPPVGSIMMQAQDADRLRLAAESFLKAGNVRQAEPLVRQHLEYRLLQIIRKVNIPVSLDFAIKDQLKMVSNSLDAIRQSLDLYKRAGRLILSAQQEHDIDTIIVPSLIANWVSHYETATSASLDPHVLLGVLDTCEKFVDCFRYSCTCLNPGATAKRYYQTMGSKPCKCP